MKHTISVLVENHFGVLARIAGLFSARGFNIESLAVGETEDKNISRMTILVSGDETILEQVMKQLNKLIDVIKVLEISKNSVKRDLILIKVNSNKEFRSEIMQIVDIFRAKIIDITKDTMIIELTGVEDKITAFINLLTPFGIKELARTGEIALLRG
ncbi:MAG: acetolactate synthase small subunit [Elusimicrobiota bacterium]|nr:acetolactate synthase small subunit [Elusimicrobiota bacterium]